MEKGFNSDIILQGKTFHVQTEDWGADKALVVTRVYQSGSVVWTIKTTYLSIEQTSPATGQKAIEYGMREQHQKVLDQLISGALTISSLK
ncbi:MAG: hypothetical protein IPM57_03300 [Oligoflexia bacterium]|nr:hypothetical protein [Oligoflexia bacterium]